VARGIAGAVAAGLVAAGGLVAGCAQPVRDPAPPPTIAGHMLLAPDEFGEPGWRTEPASPSSQWAFAMPDCGIYKAADYPAQRHRDAVETQAFVRQGRAAHEWVEHFAPGWAARSLDDTRRVVETCVRYEHGDHSPGAPGFLESHWVEAEAFAGDESLLIGTNRVNPSGGSFKRYTAMVRARDLVVTLAVTATDGELDPAGVQELARRAAGHLR
jgi:hypothetical protein